ncbi:hypothetical protein JKP75_09025 [Blastococcus sp. TML/M2B]|uniref:hypothetical protein n=1 Tax=unclassified Blastococcus TaxID=2619396 RepID=UPI00190A96C6|nr:MULTISPECIES: hypothetical protein [unclassified Blastococcus]MBN1092684.1 hypothetical protein [Blastococcus sp. TML/M2B]MBN1097206.1 hypothetical protein [Blastococcus sp. TML/C7B]
MLLWVVWGVVVVLSVVVLGALAYGVRGAQARLAREVAAFEREVRPLADRVAATAERAARTGDGPADRL